MSTLKFSEKLARVRSSIGKVGKDSKNPHFKNTYASLDAVMEFLQPFLAEYNLSIAHRADGKLMTTYVMDNDSEGEINSSLPLPENCKPQDVGSAITYYKRYNLGMLFNLLFDEDDDGNRSSGIQPKATYKPTTVVNNIPVPEESKMCDKCGEEMVMKTGTKNGNTWRGWFCGSGERTHTVFLK